MNQERSIIVKIDDRIRLLSAVLALTDWPEREQAEQPHGVHPHAKGTRRFLADFADHAAVQVAQGVLSAGYTPEHLLSFAANLKGTELLAPGELPAWVPDGWPAQVRDFYQVVELPDLWNNDAGEWNQAVSEAENAFPSDLDMHDLLGAFFGPRAETLVFQPNLCYPTTHPISFRRGYDLVCVAPPRIAWGDNPPWPYDDDPAWAYATAFGAYARLLLSEYMYAHPGSAELAEAASLRLPEVFRQRTPDWFEQFAVVFTCGAAAIFLSRTLGKAEADAFILMENKAQGFGVLPSAVSALETYLDGYETGGFTKLADFLPIFRDSLHTS
jgi:hypothetical protein